MIKELIKAVDTDWKVILTIESQKNYFNRLNTMLSERENEIYPKPMDIFSIFNKCPLKKVKVVILGQDPYHGANQANGLSFSVHKGIKIPPSLKNIYKELASDLDIKTPIHGDLSHWAEQGVFLLNAGLTVDAHDASSHLKLGWQEFTDQVIKVLSERKEKLVFILWGGFARKKSQLIDTNKHLIIESAHPSPLSAYQGFWDSKPFSRSNAYLTANGIKPIDWEIK